MKLHWPLPDQNPGSAITAVGEGGDSRDDLSMVSGTFWCLPVCGASGRVGHSPRRDLHVEFVMGIGSQVEVISMRHEQLSFYAGSVKLCKASRDFATGE